MKRKGQIAIGLALILIFVFMALAAPLLAPNDPNATNLALKNAAPSADYPLGCDQMGRCELSRLLYGARYSLGLSIPVLVLLAAVALLVGCYSSYKGGLLDEVMRILCDILMAFPLMTAFNPSIRVGCQLEKTYRLHHSKTSRQEMEELFSDLLQRLGLGDTKRILNSYPFTLSGGMLQRLMIAAALMNKPSLLVADEATTAIDACNRIELMRELKGFCREGMSVLFVTHDLRSASVSDRILVMDRGQVVEQGAAEQILAAPKENYTKHLLNACRLERRVWI